MALRVGVIGGGQLARMMIAPAVELGIDIRVLAETEGMSAALAATAVGDYRDLDTVLAFAREVDVVTFDHEHVPQPVLQAMVAEGIRVHPGPAALQFAQDKVQMRARLAELEIPQPDWSVVSTTAALSAFISDHGGRAVVKTPRGGYDGKGVRVVSDASEVADWFVDLAANGSAADGSDALLVEEFVPFVRELAQQVARNPSGQTVVYPVVQTQQEGGVCGEVIAPAPSQAHRLAEVAAQIGTRIANELGVTGMLAVELFETDDERILVNELAMRPHNSGHWSQNGAVTDQFEQHLRAVADLPLGSTQALKPWSVMVNILGGPEHGTIDERRVRAMADYPAAKIHTYGKDPRPGRKVGHVNVTGDDLDEAVFIARATAAHFD